MDVEPFSIAVEEDVSTISASGSATRWPGAAPGEAWEQGTDLAYLRDLFAYWADGFDWRARERSSTRSTHFRAEVDGVRVHFVHARRGGDAADPDPRLAERLRRVPARAARPRSTASTS